MDLPAHLLTPPLVSNMAKTGTFSSCLLCASLPMQAMGTSQLRFPSAHAPCLAPFPFRFPGPGLGCSVRTAGENLSQNLPVQAGPFLALQSRGSPWFSQMAAECLISPGVYKALTSACKIITTYKGVLGHLQHGIWPGSMLNFVGI